MPVHADLWRAFAERSDGARPDGQVPVGVFGEGVPLPLIAAFGGLALDIKAPPLLDQTEGPIEETVHAIAEPFLDSFTARFLHRFAAGAFEDHAALIFARDDVAGLAAYQYASELRRQGILPSSGPRLYLWNLLHTVSDAAKTFNAAELARLTVFLSETFGAPLDPQQLEDAVAIETRRVAALRDLPPGGTQAFTMRNAGRWLSPQEHLALLSAPLPEETTRGPQIVLVGTACDIPILHELCAGLGQVRADLQDYGRPPAAPASAADLLGAIVADPLCPRAAPPDRFTRALQDRIAGADLVVASVDSNDDCFGWEMPGLCRAADAVGARVLDLGFRPFRPDPEWQATARTRITEALS